MCTHYIKLLFNRLIQNMLSVPEFDNDLARDLYRTHLQSKTYFKVALQPIIANNTACMVNINPIYIGTHKIQIQILNVP